MSRSRPIIGGVPAPEDDAVVAVLARRTLCDGPEQVICSGTLVGPRAVLTAAHCLGGREPDELEVLIGDTASAPATVLAVWGAAVHPGYDAGAPAETSPDLMVLFLEGDAGVTPAVPADVAAAELVTGAQVQLVGFGATTIGGDLGVRVSGRATVDVVGGVSFSTGASAVPCGGDSGGAALLETAAGPRLIGVIKGSGAGCADQGLVVRVDAAYDTFLAPALAAAPPPPERPPFDPSVAYCAEPCGEHADCPLGMLCLPGADGAHCGYREARTVAVGATCDGASTSCVPVGQGLARECRELLASCPAPPATGGCGAAPGGEAGLAALIAVALMRRARRPAATFAR